MDPTVGAIIVAVLSLFGVVYVAWRQGQKPRNLDAGWEAYKDATEESVGKLEVKVTSLTERVREVENKLEIAEANLRVAEASRVEHEKTIRQQSRLIFAALARVSQLIGLWPTGVPLPPPDPAWAADLQVAQMTVREQ